MIKQEKIAAIKGYVDVVPFMQACGIDLKRNGKGYKGHCPFHEDKTPSLSVTPSKQLWKCFGCGKGGDIIEFVQLFDQVDFKTAVQKLKTYLPGVDPEPVTAKKAVKEKKLTAAHVKLLQRVIDFYHTAFCEDPRSMEYLAIRGITEKQIFSDYTIGFANGTLLNVLPNDGEVIKQLQELGILNDKGTEHFYGCVIFPLYDLAGNPTTIYGRRIPDMGSGADHLYLPGPRHGLFNSQAAKTHNKIILTEAVLDAVTLINEKIRNTIPCYGVNGLTDDHISLFKQCGVKKIQICFDNDESGKRGQEAVTTRLQQEGFVTSSIELPKGQDINSFFHPQRGDRGLLTADAKERFEALLAGDSTTPDKPEKKEKEKEKITVIENGFTCLKENRFYEVRAINKSGAKLKATVKGISGEGSKKRFHVDTVDFYSARSRAFLTRGLSELFGEEEKNISRDMEKLLELAENHVPQDNVEPDPVSIHR